jgi:4-diphosphocytidyl-2-C-methyl-D-erythritol kinase
MATDRAAAELGLVAEFAPAKVNLCLHVTGRRADGYHLLDSLVVFAGVGDRVTVLPGRGLTLRLSGPEAAALTVEPDNLVLRAAKAVGAQGVDLRLWKGLPVASGIGGGSADAAATLRALARLGAARLPEAAVLALGADVPVCLAGRPVRMQGVGELLTPLPPLPPLWLVLANPRLPVATARVFAALASRENGPVPALPAAALRSASALASWLARETRNDLSAPAVFWHGCRGRAARISVSLPAKPRPSQLPGSWPQPIPAGGSPRARSCRMTRAARQLRPAHAVAPVRLAPGHSAAPQAGPPRPAQPRTGPPGTAQPWLTGGECPQASH